MTTKTYTKEEISRLTSVLQAKLQTTSVAKDKVVTADQAVALIGNDNIVATSGFVGCGTPDELYQALERRFLTKGEPRNLTLVFAAGQGDGKFRGLNCLGRSGLLKRTIGGHYGLVPKIGQLALRNQIEAYNLPQGCLCQIFRAIASNQPGVVTKIGLGTFVDPRIEGGKVNSVTKEDIVRVIKVDNEEYLHYTYPKRIDVALIRGTTADLEGNITMEKEALTLDNLNMAIATKNSGGIVIAQVERVAANGTLNSRLVKVPGIFVDCVVICTKPENHMQTYATQYSPALSGELRIPLKNLPIMELSDRKIVARRAVFELVANAIVNLGIGMPEGVAKVANEEKVLNYITLTAEPGVIGGLPSSGLDFGTSTNTKAILDQSSQFDFYDGGGLDMAFLGMGQCDYLGNINVSRFGGKLSGCGGFINISQTAKTVIFLGTFTAIGLKIEIVNGNLKILQEGKEKKFLKKVEQITFSAELAMKNDKKVLYITERCVFQLAPGGLELIEIAPGIDLQKDILDHMDFVPLIHPEVKEMDFRIFQPERMGLKRYLLSIPMSRRIFYDANSHILFLNFEGLRIQNPQQVKEVLAPVEQKLKQINKPGLKVVVNYDNCTLEEEALHCYSDSVKELIETYQYTVIRYSTNAFLRMKFGNELVKRNLKPHLFESANQAADFLERKKEKEHNLAKL